MMSKQCRDFFTRVVCNVILVDHGGGPEHIYIYNLFCFNGTLIILFVCFLYCVCLFCLWCLLVLFGGLF